MVCMMSSRTRAEIVSSALRVQKERMTSEGRMLSTRPHSSALVVNVSPRNESNYDVLLVFVVGVAE